MTDTMRVLSLFSGVGGMDLGLERSGMQVVGMCEIDKHARSVLAHHWPDVPIHDDVTTLETEQWRGRVDIVAGGSPCQDLSVAGRRKGLDGARSGLFWHQCRIADSVAARWVLWENVAGALTSNNGADFAAVLWGITGAYPRVPDGGWRSAGVVVGPKRSAVWRLLDAQYFGVAQRRRRVFVVGSAGNRRGHEALLEPEGMRWHSASSRTSREEIAGAIATRPQRGDLDTHGAYVIEHMASIVGTLCARDSKDINSDDLDTKLIAYGRSQFANYTEGIGTLQASHRQEDVVIPHEKSVRRLTPRECERLMSWPDDWTRYRADGKEQADSHRYKQAGNGVVSNVAEWIGRRIMQAQEETTT